MQGTYFYVGHSTIRERENRKRGLVNIAAFLAHSKTVAVHDSVCDEQNVDGISDKFPISNACGQFGQTYQNLRCDISESDMECPPDPGLQMSAVAPLASSDVQNGPPPFFCGPRMYFPFTGYYDGESNTVSNDVPFANRGKTASCHILIDHYFVELDLFHVISNRCLFIFRSWTNRRPNLLLLGARSSTSERSLPLRQAKLLHWSKSN